MQCQYQRREKPGVVMSNNRYRSLSKAAVSAFFLSSLLLPIPAQAAGTLQKIAESGTVFVGYRESSPPFSYLAENKQPIGYSVELCAKVVEAVKRELKRADLAVKYVPVSSSTRISALTSREIDLECGSTTSTAERRKEVDFTIPTFIAAARLLVRENSGIKSIFDLSGKTVVTTQGTSTERFFKERNDERSLRATLILGKDHTESFTLLESGKAHAFIMDDVLLYSLRSTAKNPEEYSITRDALTVEPLAIMLRKDDPSFKKLVDTEIARVITTGEVHSIYRKWFESPIPPHRNNLKMPMSYMLRDSFKMPTAWLPN